MKDPNAIPEILAVGIQDKHPWVRLWALKNKNVTIEHINIALNDPVPEIRELARNHPLNNGLNRFVNRVK